MECVFVVANTADGPRTGRAFVWGSAAKKAAEVAFALLHPSPTDSRSLERAAQLRALLQAAEQPVVTWVYEGDGGAERQVFLANRGRTPEELFACALLDPKGIKEAVAVQGFCVEGPDLQIADAGFSDSGIRGALETWARRNNPDLVQMPVFIVRHASERDSNEFNRASAPTEEGPAWDRWLREHPDFRIKHAGQSVAFDTERGEIEAIADNLVALVRQLTPQQKANTKLLFAKIPEVILNPSAV